LLGKPLYHLALNVSGFCVKENRFVSEKEKIDAAVQYVIRRYPRADNRVIAEIGDGYETRTIVHSGLKNPIRYENIEEFYRLNPNCCSLSRRGRKGMVERDIWDVATGKISDFVRIELLLRYRNDDGSLRSFKHTLFPAVSNCGHAWSGN